MANVKKFFVVVLIVLAMAVSAVAQNNPCTGTRGKRALKSALAGGGFGAIIGGILNGGKGAEYGAAIGGGAGVASALMTRCPEAPRRLQAKKSEQAPFPERITPADRREEMDQNMPGVHIRQIQGGGNTQSLIGLLGPAMDKNGWALVDATEYGQNPTSAEYVTDVVLQPVQQEYRNGYINLYGRRGNITMNPSGGSAQFLVTIMTYRNGRYDRNLSAVNLPIVPTSDTNSIQIFTRDAKGGNGIQLGSQGGTYSVDPATMAAYQAIVQVFGLTQ